MPGGPGGKGVIASTKSTTFGRGGQRDAPGEHTTDVNIVLREVGSNGITAETESTLTDKPIDVVRYHR